MRVAIAVSGEVRGCYDCLHLLNEKIVLPFVVGGYDIDVFVHTRLSTSDDLARVVNILNPTAFQAEVNRPFDTSVIVSPANPKHAGDSDDRGRRGHLYQSYFQQYWSLSQVGRMVKVAEERTGKEYDLVIRTRPDCYLKSPLKVPVTLQRVHVPHNDDGAVLPHECLLQEVRAALRFLPQLPSPG